MAEIQNPQWRISATVTSAGGAARRVSFNLAVIGIALAFEVENPTQTADQWKGLLDQGRIDFAGGLQYIVVGERLVTFRMGNASGGECVLTVPKASCLGALRYVWETIRDGREGPPTESALAAPAGLDKWNVNAAVEYRGRRVLKVVFTVGRLGTVQRFEVDEPGIAADRWAALLGAGNVSFKNGLHISAGGAFVRFWVEVGRGAAGSDCWAPKDECAAALQHVWQEVRAIHAGEREGQERRGGDTAE